MTLSAVNPSQFFTTMHLHESELVRFLMRPRHALLDVVLIYTAETLSAYFQYLQAGGSLKDYNVSALDFRLLRFKGVEHFRTRLGPNLAPENAPQGDSEDDWISHEQILVKPSHRRLVTSAECEATDGMFECRMYFDSFGEHYWIFSQLFTGRRVARIVATKSGTEYRDESTGLNLDPSNPFEEEMR